MCTQVTQEKDSLLKAQLSAAQLAPIMSQLAPSLTIYTGKSTQVPCAVMLRAVLKLAAGDYLMRHRSEFYTAYKRL